MHRETLIVDMDNTIAMDPFGDLEYSEKIPNLLVIEKLRRLKENGWNIYIFTSRGMKTFNESITLIERAHRGCATRWLQKHNVPFDRLLFGKPWCGSTGRYIDDRNMSISEFLRCSNSWKPFEESYDEELI